MRVTSWVFPAYLAATIAILIALFAGNLAAAHVLAALPFAIILIAMLTAPERATRPVLAGAGVFVSALTVASFGSSAGDLAGEIGILAGTALLAFATLAFGGWQAIRRNRVGSVIFLIAAGFFTTYALIGVATTMPATLHPPAGCVDTCWAAGVGALLSFMMLAEILLGTLIVAALAKNRRTGLGALAMAIGQNMLFLFSPPHWSVAYAIAVPAWLAGLLILTAPWTQALPRQLRRAAAQSGSPALE